MVRKKVKKLLAITLSTVLAVSGYPIDGMAVKAQVTETKNTTENVYKVELDESGKVVADNSSDLVNQTFSWDNATVYFVLTDRFKNGDKSNDHSYGRGMQADGKTAVEGLDTYTNPGTFHGGDIKGLTEKVEDGYFNDLGVNAIWITAPYEQIHGYTSANVKSNNANTYPDPEGKGFPYYSYHGYWTLDYTNMDANMGTAQEFETFVDSCHEKGIRVVMDIVMNHVGYTTMQDAVDYGFDGALKGDWKSYYYGNSTYLMGGDPESTNYWDKESSAWSKWWGAGFVRANYPGYDAAGGDDTHMSLSGLPDVVTESTAKEVSTPPLLVTKWTEEGRLDKEQGELDDYFKRTGNKKQPRYYIIKWLTDWVREYGVDGFRCDTAKHVDLDAWKDLKTEAISALKEWRANNPDKPGANWTDDFWMTGEAWGHGMGKSAYFSNGFDSMINFSFPKDGNIASLEGTYSNYATTINSDSEFNVLSYVASHDDSAGVGVFTADDKKSQNLGTSLLLAPGAVQIYYGNEVNRQIGWKDYFTGSDYLDQRYRTDMPWDSYPKDVLVHWQKVGTFRNKHLAVGAGQHEMLEESPYTFARTYHLEEEDEDKVVCCLPGKAGTYDVNVGSVFEDGETVTDAYSGKSAEVSGGKVSFTCDENGVILIQGSGIVKASVSAKSAIKTATYSAEKFEVTLKANKAKDTKYSINGGAEKEFTTGDTITLGGDTAYGEETTLTLTGISEDDGSSLSKTVTYKRSAEPAISNGTFCVKASKKDFPTAPNIFVYTNDDKETALNGVWPGAVMQQDPDDSEYWSFTIEDREEDACIILSLGATANSGGTWRSTPDKAKGLVVKGSMSYDKSSNELTELPSGDPGKVTINYVDQDGEVLKSIYRVGAVGKKYTTYAADIDGYKLVETPKNATGEFEENGTVTYVYAKGDGPVKTKEPVDTATPKPNETDKPGETSTPKPTVGTTDNPKVTNTPKPTTTASNTNKPTNTAIPKPSASVTTPKPTTTPSTDIDDANAIHATLKTSKGSPQALGNKITLTASATGGTGNYLYKFYTKDSKGKISYIQKEYSDKNKVTWTPTVAGTYQVIVSVQDLFTGKTSTASVKFNVTKTYFTLKDYTVKASGKKITMKASVIPAKGKVRYKFVVKLGKKTIKNYGYSTKGSKILKVKKKGTYKVTMYAKDSSATVYATKTIKVK